MKRNCSDLEEATDYKIAYYDKKLKENNDTLDRKESIIENLRVKLAETENRTKFLEDKLARSMEENENLKKHKSDNARKEELLKDYKEKL